MIENYHVTELSGLNIQYDALSASGLPAYGQPHDTIPNVWVNRRAPKPFQKSRSEVQVEIQYGPPNLGDTPETIVRFNGTTRETRTSYDRDRQLIKVNYTPTGGSALPEQIGQVRGSKALGVLTFDYVVPTDPSGLLVYLNKVSSAPWRGGAAYTWFCSDMQIEKVLYRPGWRLHLAFQYDEETFIPTAAYRLLTGVIPKDIDTPIVKTNLTGNGWTNPKINGETDFTTLALPTTF